MHAAAARAAAKQAPCARGAVCRVGFGLRAKRARIRGRMASSSRVGISLRRVGCKCCTVAVVARLCIAGCGFWKWRGLVVGARRVDVGLGPDEVGWGELGRQGGPAKWGAKVLASGGCWELTVGAACQDC